MSAHTLRPWLLVIALAAPAAGQESAPAGQRLLFDFADGAPGWRTVNDNVMGGRSRGGFAVEQGVLVFSGSTNTDGGGFSSVRAGVAQGALDGVVELHIGAVTDGRAYELQVDDAVSGRVTHYGALALGGVAGVAAAAVDLTDLEPRVFGTVVDAEPFAPALATSIGFILADGVDGPFDLTIDWIDACR